MEVPRRLSTLLLPRMTPRPLLWVLRADEDGSENFISCASCATNSLAPMPLVKAIQDEFEITEAL
eukprot:scaffold18247_cov102-Skeletonema_dohrnii-CCMP3373.AAC.2